MGFLDSVTSGVGNLVSSAASMLPGIGSSVLSRQMDISSAKDAREFSADQAGIAWDRSYGAYKQRYQDTAADMRAAGINPIMAATGGFNVGNAATAQLPQTTMPSGNYLQGAPASAASLAAASKRDVEVENIQADSAKKASETIKNLQLTKESVQEVFNKRAQERLTNAQEQTEFRRWDAVAAQANKDAMLVFKLVEEIKQVRAAVENIEADTRLTNAKVPNVEQDTKTLKAKQAELIALVKNLNASTANLKELFPKLSQQAEAYRGPAGSFLGYLGAATDAGNASVSGHGSLNRSDSTIKSNNTMQSGQNRPKINFRR